MDAVDHQGMRLRDGTEIEDPRLDRLVEFDEASRDYPIRQVIREARKPRSYTWRVPNWLDQGREGACVGFAWAHELSARPFIVPKLDDTFARNLYWEAQKIDEWPGGSYPGANPRYEGTSILAGAKATVETGHITEYRWAFGIDDLVLALGYAGPAVLGLNWHEGMFEPDEDGFIHPTGKVMGGHAILAYSVNLRLGVIRLHNSWGKKWGRNGACWMKISDMDKLLKAKGEACIPVTRVQSRTVDVR